MNNRQEAGNPLTGRDLDITKSRAKTLDELKDVLQGVDAENPNAWVVLLTPEKCGLVSGDDDISDVAVSLMTAVGVIAETIDPPQWEEFCGKTGLALAALASVVTEKDEKLKDEARFTTRNFKPEVSNEDSEC
jgi:hypothetical protein